MTAGPRPTLKPELTIRMLHDGCAVLADDGETVHVLNASAAYILILCDGTRTVSDLAAELCGATEQLTLQTAERDVETCIHELEHKGILTT